MEKRLEMRKWLYLIFPAAIPLVLFFVKPALIGGIDSDSVWLYVILAFPLLPIIVFYSKRSSHNSELKKKVMNKLLDHFDKSLKFNEDDHISEKQFEESELFGSFNRYSGEDLIDGNYKGVPLKFSELDVRRVTGSGKDRSEVIIFNGLFVIGKFNKNLKSKTYVHPDVAEGLLGKLLGNFVQKIFGQEDLVKLENVEFEKRFVVYSNDQIEARYILTPDFMERVIKLDNHFNAGLRIAFKDNKVFIAVDIIKDLFEFPITGDIANIKILEEFFSSLEDVFEIIHVLDLNKNIWGAEGPEKKSKKEKVS